MRLITYTATKGKEINTHFAYTDHEGDLVLYFSLRHPGYEIRILSIEKKSDNQITELNV